MQTYIVEDALTIDVLFIVNSPLAFCDWREDAYIIIGNAKKIIWVQNDYALTIKKDIREIADEIWSTVPVASLMEYGITRKYINWNKLTWREGLMDTIIPKEAKKEIGTKEGLFYHGSFRRDRVPLFKEYFIHRDFDVNISAPSKVAGKFRTLANINFIKYTEREKQSLTIYNQLGYPYQIGGFQTALYIEDLTKHNRYCSPANRFYEYLNAEVAILFDINSRDHMLEAGYDVEPYTVYNRRDIPDRLEVWEEIAKEQKRLWARDYRSELKQEFLELCQNLL